MVYSIKAHLIEEGVLQHVKDNIGKYTLGAAGLAAAGAGEFGDNVQNMTHAGADAAKAGANGLADSFHRTMDNYSGARGHEAGAPNPNSGTDLQMQADNSTKHKADIEAKEAHNKAAEAALKNNNQYKVLHPNEGQVTPGTYIDKTIGYDKDTFDPDTGKRIVNPNNDYSLNTTGKFAVGGLGLAAAGAAALGGNRYIKRNRNRPRP